MSDVIELHGHFYIRANASIADSGTRVLKHAETFAIFDRHGDIRPLGFENQGVFHEGTRFLSRWKLGLSGTSPLLLSSNVKEENDFLVVDLTNPALPWDGGRSIPHGTLHLARTIFLWESHFFERLDVSNFAPEPVSFALELSFQADYTDLFEIRGNARKARGRLLPTETRANEAILGYEGRDSVVRRTRIRFSEVPREISGEKAVFRVELDPRAKWRVESQVGCSTGGADGPLEDFERASGKVRATYEDYRRHVATIETSNPQFNDWIDRSQADLHLLQTKTTDGPYPYAGIPWFSCIFGRDGIVTALETLWIAPETARGVLSYLAARQAREMLPAKDAEPGKILHEERKGEMAALGEVPFGSYYGSIDSTPLWIILAGSYCERTGDREFVEGLWPNVERALAWIDHYGDSDGDGFVEYRQKAGGGLDNQGWKDSGDAIFHAAGRPAAAPIALCEVQGYVYEAKLNAARIAEAIGRAKIAEELRAAARRLKARFHEAFWCEDIQMYAIALDGEKRACRARSSNAGQCLFTGIAPPDAARRIQERLLGEDFFSGWGIRTIGAEEARYNPMSYHNGSIWPHDNALIARGFARYGFKDATLRVLNALFDASRFMELNRLPELYCGFRRRRGEGPTLYPVACNPQAWSSASVFCLIQACLGLRIDAAAGRLFLENPRLPESLQQVEIKDLKIGSAILDLALLRHGDEVGVNVRRRVGAAEVVVVHGGC